MPARGESRHARHAPPWDERRDAGIERGIGPETRRARGQHFTRDNPADLMAALCIRMPGATVLDPACGTGALLRRAAARLRFLGGGGRIAGVELDPRIASAARGAVPGAEIVTGDFLGRDGPALPRRVDAVLGNPPYVRHERIGAQAKAALPAAPFTVSRRSDLHVHFWPRALARLRPGGRLGFLTSATWIDAAYGAPLRRWLMENFHVVAIVEPQSESWFDDARIRTLIVIVEKPGGERAPSGARAAKAGEGKHSAMDRGAPRSPTRFVRLDVPLSRIVPDELDPEERLARFDSLARGIERGTLPEETGSIRDVSTCAGIVPETGGAGASTARAHAWGALLRLPAIHFEILDRGGDRMVPLGEVATVRWGIKSGDDRVFFRHRDAPPPVEPRWLAPAVFSLMDLDRLVVTQDQLPRRVILVDGPAASPRLRAWIAAAERDRGSHQRPTCAARARAGRAWYELRPRPAGSILWSIMQQYRHLVPCNPQRFPVNDNLLQIDPRDGVPAALLAALLNSHVVALLKHGWGRRRNEGMLKTQAFDVRALPIPDPRRIPRARAAAIIAAFERIGGRSIGRVAEECVRADRRALDRLVLRGCGFKAGEVDGVLDRLASALQALHAGERALELDSVRRRRKGKRGVAPAGAERPPAPAPRDAPSDSAALIE